MEEIKFTVGDYVYFYSSKLDILIEGTVEGFDTEDRRRLKIIYKDKSGFARHIVSWAYVFSTLEEASDFFDEIHAHRYKVGCRVSLRGHPDILFQVTAVYSDKARVSLVNIYKEPVGTFSFYEIEYISDEPLFSQADFEVGETVYWIENDQVYSGRINTVLKSTARVEDIKLLYPVDHQRNIPYYKLHKEDADDTTNIPTVIGDNLDV